MTAGPPAADGTAHSPPPRPPRPPASVHQIGLLLLFQLARVAPRLLTMLRPLAIGLTLLFAPSVRRAIDANGRRLLGPDATPHDRLRYRRGVVGSFFDFIVEIGLAQHRSAEQLRSSADRSQAEHAYRQTRASGNGANLLTAHMGCFETGLALLTQAEPTVHVVFKRDAHDGFEQIRRQLRQKLGVREAPIDDGWLTWIALRDALLANEVVVMQGDRAWPGQKSAIVPLLGGHIRIPLGPFKLAQITGSPLVPVFTVRTPTGDSRPIVEAPIHVDPDADLVHGRSTALREWAAALERQLRAYPQQWLVLHPAFIENSTDAAQPQ